MISGRRNRIHRRQHRIHVRQIRTIEHELIRVSTKLGAKRVQGPLNLLKVFMEKAQDAPDNVLAYFDGVQPVVGGFSPLYLRNHIDIEVERYLSSYILLNSFIGCGMFLCIGAAHTTS